MGRNQELFNVCKFGRQQRIQFMAIGNHVDAVGRQFEQEGLNPIVQAKIAGRWINVLEGRVEGSFVSSHCQPS